MYRILFQDLAGEDHFYIPYDSWNTNEELNRGYDGAIYVGYKALNDYCIRLGTNALQMLTSEPREVKILKGDDVIFYGGLISARFTWGREQDESLQLQIADFFGILRSRRTPAYVLESTGTNIGDIVWNRIVATQAETNGDLGITRGTNSIATTAQKTMRLDRISDLLVEFSKEKRDDGYDFNIDTNKQLNTVTRRGSDKPEIVVDGRNTLKGSYKVSLWGQLVNRGYGIGAGYGDDQIQTVRNLTTNRATWGLHEEVISEKGVELVSTLNSRVDQFLSENDAPDDTEVVTIEHLDGVPDIRSYEVGDSITVIINDLGTTKLMRVAGRRLSSKGGHVLVTLDLQP